MTINLSPFSLSAVPTRKDAPIDSKNPCESPKSVYNILLSNCCYSVERKDGETLNNSNTHNQRIAKMTFASVYPMYVAKVEKKGRSKEELHQVITWLTDFDDTKLQQLIDENATFDQFFQRASLNPNAHLITGVICGYRVEEIEDPLTQQVRYLDKLVDELAKGRKMEKILRGS